MNLTRVEMIISNAQRAKLGESQRKLFVDKTVIFLKENTAQWAESKSDEQIIAVIDSLIAIGKDRNIKKEINIQKLAYHWIKYDLKMPPSAQIDTELRQVGLGEDYRVKCMIKAIRKNGAR